MVEVQFTFFVALLLEVVPFVAKVSMPRLAHL